MIKAPASNNNPTGAFFIFIGYSTNVTIQSVGWSKAHD